MNRYALIKSNVVANIAVASSSNVFSSSGYDAIVQIPDDFAVEVGWSYNGSILLPHTADTLAEAKDMKTTEIDDHTEFLISKGFFYQGLQFSLSLECQTNLTRISQFADQIVPFTYSTIDNTASISILTADEARLFVLAGVSVVGYALVSGNALKDMVRACTTISQVTAIVDSR